MDDDERRAEIARLQAEMGTAADGKATAPTPAEGKPTLPSNKGCLGGCLMLCALAVIFVLIFMFSGEDSTGGGVTAVSSEKYDQSWAQSYSSTTCAEWNAEMTTNEQWVAAADMLTGARNKGDGGIGVAPDALVSTFRGGVTTACVIDTMNIAEVGAALYLTERSRFAP